MTADDVPTAPPHAVRPVVSGFHPDPTVCRVGDTYYLACSSFEYVPGVPVFRSTDLVHWEQIGSALDRASQLPADAPPSGGIYAPTLRHHDGRFWLVTTNVSDGGGHLIVTAQDPAGPWSEPVRIADAGGIDPDLAWDDDGTCYLTWSDDGIRQAELDPATGRLLTAPRRLWSGTGGHAPEGPHLYRVGGTWYLLIAEGGTSLGHAVTIARGPTPSGPFEPSPHNPLLTARGTSDTVQSTGHADLVQRPDGTWAALYLGVRHRGTFPGWHVLGRETFGTEIVWTDRWPRRGAALEPLTGDGADGVPDTALPDPALPGVRLGPEWVGVGAYPGQALRPGPDGWVLTRPDDVTGPVFVGRRQQHRDITVTARLDVPDGRGALEIRIDPRHAVALEVTDDQVRAVARVGSLEQVLDTARHDAATTLELQTRPPASSTLPRERGPDEILAVVHGPDGTLELGRLDGRYLSTEVAGGFTGRTVGVGVTTGSVTVRELRYRGEEPT
ncbi:glycoside hydrolase family 43 protein [Isoptericola chiayiensis]|uniref:Glycoside hydrolase family 43 protein n=1 Tax=Isoptericola chiayiensis TaxID=579446 RepID=A0ABP8YN70_9MICO|nr:glycoside hydrolase family 43 protein [Isoptericola chiayiensis]NOW00555.1 hypothetical protein [Isoptericola chiayiensis]